MKIAYISIPALADSDLSLLHELSKEAIVDYFLISTNTSRQGTVIDITLKEEGGIFDGTAYPELEGLNKWIDLKHLFIINKPVDHDYAWINFKVSWQWMRMLKRNNYDIIHVTWPLRYNSFPLYLLHDKMVLTMHDPIPHSSHISLQNRFHRWCSIRLTPYFFLLNTTQKDEFQETYHVEASRVFLSRLSIYTHLKHSSSAPPLCKQHYILYIGSIYPHKGIEYLCEAMEPIVAEQPDINIIIAGKGDFYFDKSRFEENPRYIFINRFITNEELVSLISNSIAVVCPYIDATQSGVIMSAFALNKPVIATNVGALPEMVKDGRTGFLVPPKDSKAIEKAVREIIQPGVAQQMSENIEKDYSTGSYSWSNIAEKMLENYQTMIQNRKK